MKLSEFVERGRVGTRADREAFETGLVEGLAIATEVVGPPPGPTILDADAPLEMWELLFGVSVKFLKDDMGGWKC